MTKSKGVGKGSWPCLRLPNGCPCRCHDIRGKQKARARKNRSLRDWTPAQEQVILDGLVKGLTYRDISVQMNQLARTSTRFQPRTPGSIRLKVFAMGLSVREYWRSQAEMALLFNVSPFTVSKWRITGKIEAVPWGNSIWWRFLNADVEKFVDDWAGKLFQPEQIQDASLQQRAQVAAIKNTRGMYL